jgi:hypothetical protein
LKGRGNKPDLEILHKAIVPLRVQEEWKIKFLNGVMGLQRAMLALAKMLCGRWFLHSKARGNLLLFKLLPFTSAVKYSDANGFG